MFASLTDAFGLRFTSFSSLLRKPRLDIKKGSPFPFTFPVELASGCVGYVPTEEAMGEHGGGYETRLTSYSNLVVSAGSQIVETSIQLAKMLKPDEIPKPPLARPFISPWSYGNVRPELE